MRRSREMIEQKHYELTAMVDRVLDDTAHDLRIISEAVIEIRDGGSENRDQNIDLALGLIDELIGTLE